MSASTTLRPIILCPLRFEQRALERAGLAERAELHRLGPGAEPIVRLAERLGPTNRRVILAGLAGALRDTCRTGEGHLISTVISHDGRQFRAESGARGTASVKRHSPRAVIASVSDIVTTPHEKRALAEKTGADLVDLESGVFAQAASILGWRWAIVRGVSDAHDVTLPPDIARWVTPEGDSRFLVAAASLARRPWMAPTVMRLRRDAATAMSRVADLLHGLLDEDSGKGPTNVEAGSAE